MSKENSLIKKSLYILNFNKKFGSVKRTNLHTDQIIVCLKESVHKSDIKQKNMTQMFTSLIFGYVE